MDSPDPNKVRTRKTSFLLGFLFAGILLTVLEGGAYLLTPYFERGLPITSPQEDLTRIMRRGPDWFWALQPNMKGLVTEGITDGTPTSYTVTTNDLGLRTPPIGPKGSRYRILAIGDSTTFGQFVNDAETWPAQLQALLDPGAQRIEVINAGLAGASSLMGLSYLVNRGIQLKPDLVIATYGFNDWATGLFSDTERARRFLIPIGAAEQSFREAMVRKRGLDPMTRKRRATPGEYLDRMVMLHEVAAQHGAALMYVIWPCRTEPGGNAWRDPYGPLIIEAGRITGAPVIDLRTLLPNAPENLYIDSIHANPAGCRAVAERVAAVLEDRLPAVSTSLSPRGSP